IVPGPRLGGESLRAAQLAWLVRRGLDENEVAVLGEDQQHVIRKQQLAMAVAFAFPLPLAVGNIDADENAVVEAVDVAVAVDRVRELGLQREGLPEWLGRETTPRFSHLQ